MNAIDYAAPATIAEAVRLLADKGDRARILAGGTDLIVQLREGRRHVDLLVDIKHVPEVNELSYDPKQGLRLGAAVPCYRIYEDAAIAKAYPGLIDAVSLVGGIQIQSRASVGGNLCNSSPAADTVPALIALEAVAVIAGPRGQREVPVEQFCTGPGRNVLTAGEFLVSLRLPPPRPYAGASYLRFIRATKWTSPLSASARRWCSTPAARAAPRRASVSGRWRRHRCWWPMRPRPWWTGR